MEFGRWRVGMRSQRTAHHRALSLPASNKQIWRYVKELKERRDTRQPTEMTGQIFRLKYSEMRAIKKQILAFNNIS
jgi:hypothetical protein